MKHAITVVLLLLAGREFNHFRRHVYANRTSTGEGYIGFGWVVS